AEDVAKNVAKGIGKSAGPATESACPHVGIHTGMPVTVIGIPFLRIGQHLVSLLGFLEFFLRRLAVRIAVRMVFHRELAIRLLEFILGGILRYAQYFVIIALRHTFETLLYMRKRRAEGKQTFGSAVVI